MANRWTLRRSGDTRTTIRVAYHVPRDLVDWLAEHLEWSEAKSMRWIRPHVGTLAAGWHGVCWVAGDDDPLLYDLDYEPEERYNATAVYEGPDVVAS